MATEARSARLAHVTIDYAAMAAAWDTAKAASRTGGDAGVNPKWSPCPRSDFLPALQAGAFTPEALDMLHKAPRIRQADCAECGIPVLYMASRTTICSACEEVKASKLDYDGSDYTAAPMFGRDDMAAIVARNNAVMAKNDRKVAHVAQVLGAGRTQDLDLRIGATVRAGDRDNFGTIYEIDNRSGEAFVYFINKEVYEASLHTKGEATVWLPLDILEVVR